MEPVRRSSLRVLRRAVERCVDEAQYQYVNVVGRLLGISCVVQYLRNPNPRISVRILRSFGARIGNKTTFKRSVLLDNVYEDQNSRGDLSNLRVGANVYIGDSVFFDLANTVTVEDNVVVSARVAFITHADCNRSAELSSRFRRRCAPVTVKAGSWICYGATLLQGVSVGENAVVSAGSIVKKDVESCCIVSEAATDYVKAIE